MSMFIDDAEAGRPNRHRMLNNQFSQVGVYSCPHKSSSRNGSMTVIDYVGSLALNANAQQGIMAARETNTASLPAASTPMKRTTNCSDLPKHIVSDKSCFFFE